MQNPQPKLLDAIARDSHVRRILWLRRQYGLQWLVDQTAFNVATIYELQDEQIVSLLNLMERARECIVDGIPFEDAGLVQSVLALRGISVSAREAERQADLASMAVIGGMHEEIKIDDDEIAPF